jgi:type III secretion protein D
MSASQTLKQLRILGGTHAGAVVELSLGNHSLGHDDDCDIAITDWPFAPLALRVGGDGAVDARWSTPDGRGGATAHRMRLEDFVPCDFGGIVVCAGPAGDGWPADAELRAATPAPRTRIEGLLARVPSRRRPLVAGAAVLSVLFVGTCCAVAAGAGARKAPAPTLASTSAALQRSLDAIAPNHLSVSAGRGALTVDGLLDTADQAGAARAAIAAASSPFPLQSRFSVASDVAEAIRGAVGLPGAQVRYMGNGVFRFVAKTQDVAATQAAVEGVQADLAPAVKRIDAELEEIAASRAPDAPMLSSLTADGLAVLQTRDGVKHLVLTDPPPEPAMPAAAIVPPVTHPWAGSPASRSGVSATPPGASQ